MKARMAAALVTAVMMHLFFFTFDGTLIRSPVPVVSPNRSITITLFQVNDQKKPATQKRRKVKPVFRKIHKKRRKPEIKKLIHRQIKKPLPRVIEVPAPKLLADNREKKEKKEELRITKEEEEIDTSIQKPKINSDEIEEPFDVKPIPLTEAVPVYKINPPPRYPAVALRRGIQGKVIIQALVNIQGGVVDLKIFKSSGYAVLDKAAIRAVKTWLFIPAMRGKTKIDSWIRVPVRFALR